MDGNVYSDWPKAKLPLQINLLNASLCNILLQVGLPHCLSLFNLHIVARGAEPLVVVVVGELIKKN